jgi:hypothetical protein
VGQIGVKVLRHWLPGVMKEHFRNVGVAGPSLKEVPSNSSTAVSLLFPIFEVLYACI